MQSIKDLDNFVRNLGPRSFFILTIVSWMLFVVVRRLNRQWLTSGILVLSIAFTVIWFEILPRDDITEIGLELLKIIISWPFVILIIVFVFRTQIGNLLTNIGKKISEATTTEVGIGDLVKVKLDSPQTLGTISVPPGEPAREEIVKFLRTETQQLPIELLPGVAEVFVGQESAFEGVSVSSASGFVIDERGLVVTFDLNFGYAQEVFVRLFNEDRILPATVVKRSFDTFLALLKIPQGTYPSLKLSQYPDIGEQVLKMSLRSGVSHGRVTGIGGVLRIQNSVVRGIVSVEPSLSSLLGDGGAPVLNRHREVVGVMVARNEEPSSSLLISADRIREEFLINAS